MAITENKKIGDQGELEVITYSPCPNCGNVLDILSINTPLFDVRCTKCVFRAQVKSSNKIPSSTILGAGWEILSHKLKAGDMVPPVFANFKWEDKDGAHQEIRFYPFIPQINLKSRQLSPTAQRANYKMFNYIGMDEIPFFVMYKK